MRPAVLIGCALAPLVAALLLALLGPTSPASAAEQEPYGEVNRFGGFNESGTKLGEFVSPVGFAVDQHSEEAATPDQNAVYVLDLTAEELEAGKLSYRLQKLSSSGTPLGSVTIAETFSDTTNYSDANPLISLAIDSVKHRVYVLVEGLVSSGSGKYVPVAQRLDAWSTEQSSEQQAKKELVRAPGFPEDKLTKASLVAGAEGGSSELEPASIADDLYAPEGITVDPANHDVVIEAQRGVKEGPVGGPTVLQRVSTEAPTSGTLDGEWVATAPIAPHEEQADGVFTATNGSFGIDLFNGWGAISRLAEVKPDFATPEAFPIAEDHSGGANLDEAPTIDNPATINFNSNHGGQWETTDFETTAAGSPITQLTNNLYAARYGGKDQDEVDGQGNVTPWNEGGIPPLFWNQGSPSHEEAGNMGVRLFTANGAVIGTIGGQASGQPCSLDFAQLAVAAGANGSLFVLTQPNKFFNPLTEVDRDSDDQVIEFAPGQGSPCPAPKGEVEVNGKEASAVTVHQKERVDFDAISIKREGETPYELDWNFEGKKSGGTAGTNDGYELGAKMQTPSYTWPSPEVKEYKYEKAGVYKASLRLIGDYGTSIFPIEVKVEPSEPAVAEFTAPEPIVAGQAVTFNGEASKGTPGSPILDYHWEYSDGSPAVDTQTPQSKPHTFASSGEYEVKLEITDEVGEKAHVVKKVKVMAPAGEEKVTEQPKSEETSTAPGSTPSATPSIAPPVIAPAIVKPTVKPLTSTQKLAAALKVCKKIKSKTRRVSCEKQAKKKYVSKPKTKAKKKSAKKK